MLMLMKQWFLLLCFVTFFCFQTLTCAQAQLHPDEAAVLQKIAEKMGAAFKENFTEQDPCRLQRLPIEDISETGNGQKNNITCSQTDAQGFSHITEIFLKSLSLPGMLPPEFANLTFLRTIDLTRNYLNGTLPKEWASLQHLNTISLTANRLTGEIPREWGNFANLTYLSLEANQLSGTIPEALGNLNNLTNLILSSNQFVGSLPAALAKLKNLTDFRASDNSFNGVAPEFIGEWIDLNRLEMYSSGLVGPIPAAVFDLGNLKDLRISDMPGPDFKFPTLRNINNMENLVLRNLSMSGSIPMDIWQTGNTIDLSFNKLGGEINVNGNGAKADFTFLSGNMLTGKIPDSFLRTQNFIDFSYNRFTPLSSCPENSKLNMYRSFSLKNITNGCPTRPGCRNPYRSLHINCGGEDVIINRTRYEGDKFLETEKGAVLKYNRETKWGFISTGNFIDEDKNNDYAYTLSTNFTSSMNFPNLYSTARATPLFLTYYAYCMEKGNYTVNLHFAEILFKDEILFHRVARRIFDIYIQENLVKKDFNIKKAANGTGQEVIIPFNATVTDNNNLEIRLYWAGKGTTVVPDRGFYGPLISAISVCPGFTTNCDEPAKTNNLPIVIGVATSVLFLVLCVVGFFCWKRPTNAFIITLWRGGIRQQEYSGDKNTRERDLKGLDLQAGTFTYSQLKAATNNFEYSNKIGEGGFGTVYKGQLSDGTFIAVKQLSSKSRQGNREFVNEIGLISGLQHPNLVKLYGCCVEGNQLLLVYEYMENNCLAHALFGPEITLKLDWTTRQKICIGIARGLAFLHEESFLKIVHRDIKTTNVLLDKELNAKISDFGLAKLKEDDNTHISTRVAGTIGYMAPEYALWGQLTEKADVYSFGVVALEIVNGKSNASYRAKNDRVCLLDWALDLQQKENLLEIVDPKLEHDFNKEEAERIIKVALLCSNAYPELRPTMSEVVSMLEAQTIVQEVISGPSIYGDDLRLKSLKGHLQRTMQEQNSSGGSFSNFFSDKTGLGSPTTTTHDLYSVNSESIRNSEHDLYPAISEPHI